MDGRQIQLRLHHQVRTTNLRILCQAQPRLRRTRAAYYPRQRAHPRQDPTRTAIRHIRQIQTILRKHNERNSRNRITKRIT